MGVLSSVPAYGQNVVYVDANNTPTDCSGASTISDLDGSTWDCAYPALQDGFDEAGAGSGDYDIRVAEGVYYPDEDNVDNSGGGGGEHTDNARTESFSISRDGITVLGGYPTGGGTRDPEANPTVLSGDLEQNDNNRTSSGVTPSASDINGGNAYHVLLLDASSNSLTAATEVKGVIVSAGLADGSTGDRNIGGGILCNAPSSSLECSPAVVNTDVIGNQANFGGGMHFEASNSGGSFSPSLTRVLFKKNRTLNEGGALGLVVENGGTGSPTIESSIFQWNETDLRGGAIWNRASGSGSSNPLIRNTVFYGNSSLNDGGAIYNDGDGSGSEANPTLVNVVLASNQASSVTQGIPANGGAIYNLGRNSGVASAKTTNVILWNNALPNPNPNDCDEGTQIFNGQGGASLDISYTIVEGGQSGIANCNGASTTYDSNTNLDQDPQFVDASNPEGADDEWATSDDGLRLRGASYSTPSPAIDAGNNSAVSATTDILGNARTYDGSGDGTKTVDMGPYEYNDTPLPVELTTLEAAVTGSDAVTLRWGTASETNNAGFAVERRAGGVPEQGAAESWTEVGFVESKAEGGTTGQPLSYRFTDDDLPYAAEILTYRLRQVDTDGTVSLSAPVTVERRAPDRLEVLGTAPNPARNQATVRLAVPDPTAADDVTLALYDVMGRRVQTVTGVRSGRSAVDLDVSDLSSGVYVLRLTAGGTTRTQRLTVVQ